MSATHVKIHLMPGCPSELYDEPAEPLDCDDVVIKEKATAANLPTVDFRCRGSDGKLHTLVLTGRVVNAIATAVRSMNVRTHGTEEP